MGAQALVKTGMGRVKVKLIDIIYLKREEEREKIQQKKREKRIKKKKKEEKGDNRMGAQALVETGMGRVKFKLIDIIFF